MTLSRLARLGSSNNFLKKPTLHSLLQCRRIYQAPRWPRRELYEEEYQNNAKENRNKQDAEHGSYTWEYEYTWRDWIYDRRKYFYRAGLVAAGAGTYYWYHLESTPITGIYIYHPHS